MEETLKLNSNCTSGHDMGGRIHPQTFPVAAEGSSDKIKDEKSYSSKYKPGSSASTMVGIHHDWPVLPPLPCGFDAPAATTSSTKRSENVRSQETTSKVGLPSLPLIYRSAEILQQSKSCDDVDNNISLPAEVSIQKLFQVEGRSKSQFMELIEDFCDKWYDNGYGSGSQAAGELANQIFVDNTELVNVLITDVASYPISSKPQLWLDNDRKGDASSTTSQGVMPLSFLFNVGQEVFALFVFPQTDIVFTLELNGPLPAGRRSSVFFHGKTSVTVNFSETKKIVNIQFLEYEPDDGAHQDELNKTK